MVYSAIWKDGPLHYDKNKNIYKRVQNEKVILKCLYNSQIITNELLNKIKSHINIYKSYISPGETYGISQNPKTKNCILVFNDHEYCENCGNKNTDANHRLCLADRRTIWTDGPIHYYKHEQIYERDQNEKVFLKCLFDSKNNINEFLNKVKSYSIHYSCSLIDKNYTVKIYGIFQNPDTRDYIIVLKDEYCEKCGKRYTDIYHK
ncbi:hypothetical protein C1645_829106 [Glomus cerebriforme]|uniref:Uncharacterized protein n=1 Tax=Glomus cerebriforme TaxID=658196 RepID=A0A397SUH8_9GLOM|nr:hypothetical protein C1645_829106 [Glomus cerebriforme]